jgi:quercetin dioxygenase-like cupin family protein
MMQRFAATARLGRLWRAAAVLSFVAGAPAATYAAGAAAPGAAQVAFRHALTNAPGKSLTAVIVSYPPGGKSKPHRHAGVVFAYVLSGSVRSQVNEEPARVYRAGESFFEDLNAHHAISENASESEPAQLLAVFVAEDGATLTVFDE